MELQENSMKQAFIIMQIGNPALDKVCEDAILPSLRENGFDPKRVDKHNQGGLLKNEIIKFIENSDIIIADLINERPNCYLEIGYAMGVGKLRNLILTAREDH
jgi:nucleoside 2-deoxyribosyltransferase